MHSLRYRTAGKRWEGSSALGEVSGSTKETAYQSIRMEVGVGFGMKGTWGRSKSRKRLEAANNRACELLVVPASRCVWLGRMGRENTCDS